MSLIPSLLKKSSPGNYHTPTSATDVVGIYDSKHNQLFDLARPAKANITEASKIAEHPVESGGTISDNKVILPVEIEMLVYVTDYRNTYKKIKTAFLGKELLTIQTRTDTYENMAIEAMPHEETAEMFDVINMALKFKEIHLVKAQFQALPPEQVKKPNNASTVDRGQQTPKKSGSVLHDIFKK